LEIIFIAFETSTKRIGIIEWELFSGDIGSYDSELFKKDGKAFLYLLKTEMQMLNIIYSGWIIKFVE
jgi:hypothetical protein